ncbi:hypothetical protein EYC80_005004 [Monilinia laxa]|uniref:Uncharacterized protein n=1 Tax=Monilinia laxa TaxID=61186 RepID=A0A5N6KIU7_MONLA|nr:hypothetical protein EYC80_005004 [Monilinia laxa]
MNHLIPSPNIHTYPRAPRPNENEDKHTPRIQSPFSNPPNDNAPTRLRVEGNGTKLVRGVSITFAVVDSALLFCLRSMIR